MTAPVQTFRERMEDKQSVFKTEVLGIKQMGLWKGTAYPHVLPEDAWSVNLWREISYDAIRYFAQSDINWHAQKHSMLSSQIMYVNILFPLKEHLNIIHRWLQSCQFDVAEVVDLIFEYTSPKNYLNEKDDHGHPIPSANIAVRWTDLARRNNLLLLDFKFAEPDLGVCIQENNPDPKRCFLSKKIVSSHKGQCYKSQLGRKYWDLALSAGSPLWKDSLTAERHCPFRYDFFRLMRGQLTAHCIQTDKKSGFDRVEFGVMYHAGNEEMLRMSHPFSGEFNPIKAWPNLLHKPETFCAFTTQDFLKAIEQLLPFELTKWREYLNQRYGI